MKIDLQKLTRQKFEKIGFEYIVDPVHRGNHYWIDNWAEISPDIAQLITLDCEIEKLEAKKTGLTIAKNCFQDFCNEEEKDEVQNFIDDIQQQLAELKEIRNEMA